MDNVETIIDKLNRHHKIGVDVDSTLINGPNSHIIQQWCRENHETKELHIVTFRYGLDFDHFLPIDLDEAGVDIKMFKGVHGSPKEKFIDYWTWVNTVGLRNQPHEAKWLRALAHHKIDLEKFTELETFANNWKGFRCKELGLTALIDDMENSVLPGCTNHGIEFIHALK